MFLAHKARRLAASASPYHIYIGTGSDVKKLDISGNVIWTFSGHANAISYLAVARDDYFYSASSSDDVLKKVDSDGNQLWTKTISEGIRAIDTDDAGNVVVALSSPRGVRAYNAAGSTVWTHTYSGAQPITVAIDTSANVYFTESAANYIEKRDSAGNFVWRNNYGDTAQHITSDASGNIYAAVNGTIKKINSSGTVVLDPLVSNAGPVTVDAFGNIYYVNTSTGNTHKLDSSGTEVWEFSTSADDDDITVSDSGYVYTEGATPTKINPNGASGVEYYTAADVTQVAINQPWRW